MEQLIQWSVPPLLVWNMSELYELEWVSPVNTQIPLCIVMGWITVKLDNRAGKFQLETKGRSWISLDLSVTFLTLQQGANCSKRLACTAPRMSQQIFQSDPEQFSTLLIIQPTCELDTEREDGGWRGCEPQMVQQQKRRWGDTAVLSSLLVSVSLSTCG